MLNRLSIILRIFIKHRLVALMYWIRARPWLFSVVLRALEYTPGLKRFLVQRIIATPRAARAARAGVRRNMDFSAEVPLNSASTEVDQVYDRLMRNLTYARKR